MNRAINGGSEARVYKEREREFSSTKLALLSLPHRLAIRPVSKVRTGSFRILLLMVLIICMRFELFSAGAAEYTAQGKLERINLQDNSSVVAEKYFFSIEVNGNQWLLRLTDVDVQGGKKEGPETVELGTDGTDFYTLSSFPTHIIEKNQTINNYKEFGQAFSGTLPIVANTGERILWIALASGDYFAHLRESSMPCILDLEMATNNLSPIKWSPLSSFLQLPNSLDLTTPTNESSIGSSPFYKPGYVAFSYSVVSVTNIESITLPLVANADFFGLNETAIPPTRFAANRWVVTVTNILARSFRTSYIPAFSGGANIIDKRFKNVVTGNPQLVVSQKKGAWLDRKDTDLQSKIEILGATPHSSELPRKSSASTKLFTLGFLALSIGGLIFVLVKNKKKKEIK